MGSAHPGELFWALLWESCSRAVVAPCAQIKGAALGHSSALGQAGSFQPVLPTCRVPSQPGVTQAGWAGPRGEAELFPQCRPRALQEPSLQEQGQGQDTPRAPFWSHLLQGNSQHSGSRFELQNSSNDNFAPKSSAYPRGITCKQHSGSSKTPPSGTHWMCLL